jgi:hypothetical protein
MVVRTILRRQRRRRSTLSCPYPARTPAGQNHCGAQPPGCCHSSSQQSPSCAVLIDTSSDTGCRLKRAENFSWSGMSSAVRRLTQGALAPNPYTPVIQCTSGHHDHFACFLCEHRRFPDRSAADQTHLMIRRHPDRPLCSGTSARRPARPPGELADGDQYARGGMRNNSVVRD